MSGPLSGVGQQQQVPLSQSFQPGATREDQEPREAQVQPRGAPSAQSQGTKSEDPRDAEVVRQALDTVKSGPQNNKRGSVVNLVV